jgi:ATP-dependent RNA helicase DeaD
VLPIYGGQSYGLQVRQLQRDPQVIVGTPGRIMDHMRRGTLSLDGLTSLVLDEADEMLNMGFAEDIDWIFENTPEDRQVALFSATMPPAIRQVARERLSDPAEVLVGEGAVTVDTVDQRHCVVTRFHKLDVLTRILELEPFDGILIFVRTRNGTAELADRLRAHGFAAEPLSGDMSQDLRERTVERFKQGQLDILVATDVAARGLDVERLSHVINFDIPTDPTAYVHRIGRAGRAGRSGRAILLVEPRERGMLRAIERTVRRGIPEIEAPSAAELSASRIDRFTEQLKKTLSEQDLDFFYRLVARVGREQELELMDIAAAATYLLQRERPLDAGPAPRAPAPEVPTRDAGYRRPGRQSGAPNTGEETGYPSRRRQTGLDGPRDRPERAGFAQERAARDERGETRPHQRPPHDRDSSRGERDHRSIDMVRHRIEVGRRDGVTPGEIVGAIANEAGLEGRYIGRIEISDDHSIVDLPSGMPRELLHHLKRVYVRGRALRISVLDAPGRRPDRTVRGDSGQSRRPMAPRDGHASERPRRDGPRSADKAGPRPTKAPPRPKNRNRKP